MVRLRGAGSLPNVEGLRLVEVGTAAIRSPVLFGDFVAPAENERARAALSPLLPRRDRLPPAGAAAARPRRGRRRARRLARARERLPQLRLGRPARVPATCAHGTIDGFAERRGPRPLRPSRTRPSPFDLTAPRRGAPERAESSEVAGRRLLLVGGESAALLFAFADPRRGQHAPRHRGGAAAADVVRRQALAALPLHGDRGGGRRRGRHGRRLGSRDRGGRGGRVARGRARGRGARALDLSQHRPPGRGIAVAGALALVARGGTPRQAARPRPALVLGPRRGRARRPRGHRPHAAPRRPRPGDARAGVGHGGRARPPARARHLRRRGRLRAAPAPRRSCSWSAHPAGARSRCASPPSRWRATRATRPSRRRSSLVSVGLAVFAESYRTTLARGQEEQAAFAVPLDFTLREDLTRLITVREAAPPERLAEFGGDVQVEPVLRLSGNVSRAGGRTGITVLGLDPEAIPALQRLARRLRALSPADARAPHRDRRRPGDPRGPVIPDDATRARARRPRRPPRGASPRACRRRPAATPARQLGEPEPGRLDRAPRRRAARGAGRTDRRRSRSRPPVRVQERGGEGQAAGAERSGSAP